MCILFSLDIMGEANGGLERALILTRSAKGAACREAIEQALAAPDVHVFGELLDLPQVYKVQQWQWEQERSGLQQAVALGQWQRRPVCLWQRAASGLRS